MKRVLFIGVTKFDFQKLPPLHLQEKFSGLSGKIKPYVLARGRPFFKEIWGTKFYFLPQFFFWPLAFLLAFWLCLAKKINVIVAQSPLIEGFAGTILKLLLKKELIVEIHGDWVEGPFLSKKRKLEFIQRKFVPILAKISLRSADKIRAISEYTKNKALLVSGQKPCFVFPTFTDIDYFLNEKDIIYDNFILFVGQLEKVKGIKYLVEAFLTVKREFPDFRLVLIGEGSDRKEFEGITGVELKGKLSLAETKAIMKNCYCLVLPSLSEGLGRVLMEAMALKKPVIGSSVGGIKELIKDGENGFLFEAGNSKELAEKLRILLGRKDLALAMGRRGHDFTADKFSNKRYIKNYIEMINKIV